MYKIRKARARLAALSRKRTSRSPQTEMHTECTPCLSCKLKGRRDLTSCFHKDYTPCSHQTGSGMSSCGRPVFGSLKRAEDSGWIHVLGPRQMEKYPVLAVERALWSAGSCSRQGFQNILPELLTRRLENDTITPPVPSSDETPPEVPGSSKTCRYSCESLGVLLL